MLVYHVYCSIKVGYNETIIELTQNIKLSKIFLFQGFWCQLAQFLCYWWIHLIRLLRKYFVNFLFSLSNLRTCFIFFFSLLFNIMTNILFPFNIITLLRYPPTRTIPHLISKLAKHRSHINTIRLLLDPLLQIFIMTQIILLDRWLCWLYPLSWLFLIFRFGSWSSLGDDLWLLFRWQFL